jgi:hypothetical protein
LALTVIWKAPLSGTEHFPGFSDVPPVQTTPVPDAESDMPGPGPAACVPNRW